MESFICFSRKTRFKQKAMKTYDRNHLDRNKTLMKLGKLGESFGDYV